VEEVSGGFGSGRTHGGDNVLKSNRVKRDDWLGTGEVIPVLGDGGPDIGIEGRGDDDEPANA
jgi:hypothetical protein